MSNASPTSFERRGGAIQFGVQTSVALPIKCPNVGRIVLALYSRSRRDRDEELINRITRDVQAMNPCPRFKLIVDMGDCKETKTAVRPVHTAVAASTLNYNPGGPAFSAAHHQSNLSQTINQNKDKVRALITFLCENMPSHDATPLSSQITNIMSLRLILLRPNRSSDEEHLVESMLVLFDSYISAQRSPTEITLMLARDFAFHDLQLKQASTRGNVSLQPMSASSPPHHIVPEQNSVPHLSLDHSSHSSSGLMNSLRGNMSSFSLNSIDHSKK